MSSQLRMLFHLSKVKNLCIAPLSLLVIGSKWNNYYQVQITSVITTRPITIFSPFLKVRTFETVGIVCSWRGRWRSLVLRYVQGWVKSITLHFFYATIHLRQSIGEHVSGTNESRITYWNRRWYWYWYFLTIDVKLSGFWWWGGVVGAFELSQAAGTIALLLGTSPSFVV